jgi:hypothetical protein
MAEDIDIVFRLLLLGCSATWLKQITVCYRQHKNSMSNSNFLNTAEKAQQVLAIFFSRKDLPEYVRELEKESIYDHLVWCACQFCMRNQEKLMCQFLEKSLRYCTISKWRLEEVWLSKFEVMARSYCLEFNKNKIPANKYWQKLMKKIIKYRAY